MCAMCIHITYVFMRIRVGKCVEISRVELSRVKIPRVELSRVKISRVNYSRVNYSSVVSMLGTVYKKCCYNKE